MIRTMRNRVRYVTVAVALEIAMLLWRAVEHAERTYQHGATTRQNEARRMITTGGPARGIAAERHDRRG